MMGCVECFKKGELAGALYIHFGKSLCQACVQESIKSAKALVATFDELQVVMREASEASKSISTRMKSFLDRVDPQLEGKA